MSLLKEAIEQGYTNAQVTQTGSPDFFTEDKNRFWSGNPQLCNAVAYILSPETEIEVMGKKWFNEVKDPIAGIIYRFPEKKEVTSWDELIGSLCFPGVAKEIYNMLIMSDFYMGPDKSLRYWLGRNLGFVEFIKMRAGVKLNPVSKLLMCVCFIIGSIQDSTSGHQLLWIMNQYFKNDDSIFNIVMQPIYKMLMRKKYPGGVVDMFIKYYGDKHVYIKYAAKEW